MANDKNGNQPDEKIDAELDEVFANWCVGIAPGKVNPNRHACKEWDAIQEEERRERLRILSQEDVRRNDD